MTGRPRLDDAAMRALKTASKGLIGACGGGEAASTVCRLGPSHLSEAASLFHGDRWLPLDVVAQLEEAAEEPVVTRALARRAGCVLVPVAARGAGDLAQHLARLGREAGDVFTAGFAAMGDGHFSEAERGALVRELGELLAVGHELMAALSPPVPMRARGGEAA